MSVSSSTLAGLTPPRPPGLVLRAAPAGRECWLRFESPVAVLEARQATEVRPLLRQLEAATERGLFAAGFLTYEAASAFDPAFVTRPRRRLPLAWFALFERTESVDAPPRPGGPFRLTRWRPSVAPDEYRRGVETIRRWIARGDTYQVNYTFRLQARLSGDPWSLFSRLWRAQRGCWAAFVDTGEQILCSVSPELFFRLSGDQIVTRPMKGTAPRGHTSAQDERRAVELEHSTKNRAENLMIVDMVRNDLGRIAHPGSVRVPRLFELEKYDSLYQLTSTVVARTDASLEEIFGALFPCASITGAPKIRTMELIRDLENDPREIYTGAIGWAGPSRQACFNVAIRTAQIDRASGTAIYGTGGGIVWDSEAGEEYRECRTKALILTQKRPEFSLLETLRWEPDSDFVLLRRHLDRIEASARYFDLPCHRRRIEQALRERAERFPPGPHQLRLLLHAEGGFEIEAAPLEPGSKTWRVALAREPVDRSDRLLYHKTTYRHLYESARLGHPDLDDVILWNRDGQLTESTVANLVLMIDGQWLTPPVRCGLLPGTLRAQLLSEGQIRERVLPRAALARADAIYLINSLRGWIPARLDDSAPRVEEPAPSETLAGESP